MNNRIVIPLLVAGAVAFACGPRPNTEASTPPTAVAVKSSPVAKRKKEPTEPRLESSLVVSRGRDGSVRLALNAVNTGDKALELDFPDGQTHDVAVLDSTGREVWRWSEGRLFTQSVRTRAVGGHDAIAFRETWRPADARGRYVAVATLRSSNYPVERRVDFVLP